MTLTCVCGDKDENACLCDPDIHADLTDAMYDYHRDRLALQTDKWERRMEKLSLLKRFRRSDVDEV